MDRPKPDFQENPGGKNRIHDQDDLRDGKARELPAHALSEIPRRMHASREIALAGEELGVNFLVPGVGFGAVAYKVAGGGLHVLRGGEQAGRAELVRELRRFLGRRIRHQAIDAAAYEIKGVDTYSQLWGPLKAARLWSACVGLSLVLLVTVGMVTGVVWVSLLLGGAGAVTCWISAARYAKSPTPAAQGRMDTLAGLWVFSCYAIAGFAPALKGML